MTKEQKAQRRVARRLAAQRKRVNESLGDLRLAFLLRGVRNAEARS